MYNDRRARGSSSPGTSFTRLYLHGIQPPVVKHPDIEISVNVKLACHRGGTNVLQDRSHQAAATVSRQSVNVLETGLFDPSLSLAFK